MNSRKYAEKDAWRGLFMNIVERRSRPKPTVAARKRSRHSHTYSLSRRLSENSHAGRENRLSQQIFMNSPR